MFRTLIHTIIIFKLKIFEENLSEYLNNWGGESFLSKTENLAGNHRGKGDRFE